MAPWILPSFETILSFFASIVDPESNRRYRDTWPPWVAFPLAFWCPFVVFGRIENRIRDLESGGDGFGIPWVSCNERCCFSCCHCLCCCCCCCTSSPNATLLFHVTSPSCIPLSSGTI